MKFKNKNKGITQKGVVKTRVRQGKVIADNRSQHLKKQSIRNGHSAPIQRTRVEGRITGSTHLVKAQGKSIFKGHYFGKGLITNGTPIAVDNEVKLRSRRGPNQETFRAQDKKMGTHFYRWFKVLSVNGKPIERNVYVRDDTFIPVKGALGGRTSKLPHLGGGLFHRDRQSLSGTTRLREKYPFQEFPKLYSTGMIQQFEAIQRLLKNKGAVHQALLSLENTCKRLLSKKTVQRPTQALNMALHFMEAHWMGDGFLDLRAEATSSKSKSSKKPYKPNAKRTRIIQHADAIGFQKQFLKGVVQQVVPFKDVGAPLPHGEYAHRIQWFIIAYYYLGKWGKKWLVALHREAGNMDYLQKLKNPRLSYDVYRSLWDYVVDLRRQEADEVVPDTEKTYFASPVMVTSDLLGYGYARGKGTFPGALSPAFPVIAHAVANRRRKRAVENKLRKTPKKMTSSDRQELDRDTGYEHREAWLRKSFPDHFKVLD